MHNPQERLDHISKKLLIRLYIDECNSIHTIASILDCSHLDIMALLKRYKISFKKVPKNVLEFLYNKEKKDVSEIAHILGTSESQVWIRMKEYSIPLRKLFIPSKSNLFDDYIVNKLPYKFICRKYNISSSKLFKWLDKYGIRKNARALPDNLFLTSVQEQVLFGSLLGDGYARYSSSKSSYTLKQSRVHGGYTRWVKNILKPFSLDIRYAEDRVVYKGINKVYYKVIFDTHVHKELNKFVVMFYDNIKKVPYTKYLEQYLTPLALSVWYMEDGKSRMAFLSSMGFTKEDNERLAKFLNEKYDLSFKVVSCNCGTGYTLMGDTRKFFKLIGSYVYKVPCMRYKLPKYCFPKSSETLRLTSCSDDDKVQTV